MRVSWTVLIVIFLFNFATAQPELSGAGQFPQFRNMSGLPGAGFGVLSNGRLSPLGALSYSTPVAYSLTNLDLVFGVSNVSIDQRLSIFKDNNASLLDGNVGNGTAQIQLGISLADWGDLTIIHMMVSSLWDSAMNLHWTPGQQDGSLRYGFGVQDFFGGVGISGQWQPGDERNSSSLYGVTTYDFGKGTYASIGTGLRRFESVFGNVSFQLSDSVKAFGEYDASHWNYGVAFDAGRLLGQVREGHPNQTTFMLGMVKGKYAYWSVNVSF